MSIISSTTCGHCGGWRDVKLICRYCGRRHGGKTTAAPTVSAAVRRSGNLASLANAAPLGAASTYSRPFFHYAFNCWAGSLATIGSLLWSHMTCHTQWEFGTISLLKTALTTPFPLSGSFIAFGVKRAAEEFPATKLSYAYTRCLRQILKYYRKVVPNNFSNAAWIGLQCYVLRDTMPRFMRF